MLKKKGESIFFIALVLTLIYAFSVYARRENKTEIAQSDPYGDLETLPGDSPQQGDGQADPYKSLESLPKPYEYYYNKEYEQVAPNPFYQPPPPQQNPTYPSQQNPENPRTPSDS